MKPKYKVGNKVIVVKPPYHFRKYKGEILIIKTVSIIDSKFLYHADRITPYWWEDELIEANEITEALYAK